MSQDNVEIVKGVVEAFNRQDWDTVFKDAAPGSEWDLSRALGPYRGIYALDQMRPVINDFAATFESIRFEVDELMDAGEHVLLLGTVHFRGRGGIEATTHAIQSWTVRDGAVQRVVMYQERDEALEAVGLSDQDALADS
jgi:ketosteroid isomerase-like protein